MRQPFADPGTRRIKRSVSQLMCHRQPGSQRIGIRKRREKKGTALEGRRLGVEKIGNPCLPPRRSKPFCDQRGRFFRGSAVSLGSNVVTRKVENRNRRAVYD